MGKLSPQIHAALRTLGRLFFVKKIIFMIPSNWYRYVIQMNLAANHFQTVGLIMYDV